MQVTIKYLGQEITPDGEDLIEEIIELIVAIIEALIRWPQYKMDIQYFVESNSLSIYYDDSSAPMTITQEQKTLFLTYCYQILSRCGIEDPNGDFQIISTL